VVSGSDEDDVDEAFNDGTRCKKVKRGDMCYDLVVYTVRKLLTNKEFYPGLSPESSEEQVQARLHVDRPGICPRPCVKGDKRSSEKEKPFKSLGDEDYYDDDGDDDDDDVDDNGKDDGHCQNAIRGTDCWDTIIWVLNDGVFKHPKWFQGLNQASSMKEVQAHLHKERRQHGMPVKCPMPCEEKCETAQKGDPCHHAVTWAMEEGIRNLRLVRRFKHRLELRGGSAEHPQQSERHRVLPETLRRLPHSHRRRAVLQRGDVGAI